jgi:hydroxyacylglutathione hydrolase
MYIQQFYTKCLSEATYYIESGGHAAIIDPLRDIAPYIELAKQRGAQIHYIFETHFHADFVSGHVDLARHTGAQIVYGPTTLKTGFKAHIAKDGEEFRLGLLSVRLIHTPGHTMESSCYLLTDEEGRDHALFTGDTLFIGDVGRPDLAQKVIAILTPQKLAAHLYDSLRNKIMTLPDDLIIYPGHGAGSACGKNMSSETSDTLGHQKKVNYALNPSLTKEEFIVQVLEGLTPPPAYFPKDVMKNINGYEDIDTVLKRAKALSPEEFLKLAEEGTIIIDTRHAQSFAENFIPDSVNIGIDGSFAVWAGTLMPDINAPILVVADDGREKEAVIRLARVGCDNIQGYLKGGMNAWLESGKPVDKILSITAQELHQIMRKEKITLVDVRREAEYLKGHVKDAVNVPLDYIYHSNYKFNMKEKYYVCCAGGYRSMTFISLLRLKGYYNLVDVKGGFQAMEAVGNFDIVRKNESLA